MNRYEHANKAFYVQHRGYRVDDAAAIYFSLILDLSGLSLPEIARETGVHASRIYLMRCGCTFMALKDVQRVAEVCGFAAFVTPKRLLDFIRAGQNRRARRNTKHQEQT